MRVHYQTIHNDKVGDCGHLVRTLSCGQGEVDIAKGLHSSTSESLSGGVLVSKSAQFISSWLNTGAKMILEELPLSMKA
ncbi:unnamed protein product [Prunus armeniaca]